MADWKQTAVFCDKASYQLLRAITYVLVWVRCVQGSTERTETQLESNTNTEGERAVLPASYPEPGLMMCW